MPSMQEVKTSICEDDPLVLAPLLFRVEDRRRWRLRRLVVEFEGAARLRGSSSSVADWGRTTLLDDLSGTDICELEGLIYWKVRKQTAGDCS